MSTYLLVKNGNMSAHTQEYSSPGEALAKAKSLQEQDTTATWMVIKVIATVKTEYIERQVVKDYTS
jgi:hypothetical protein